ncbi:hypothetical protein DFO66_11611 [Brevibacterium sanguinis]|uniref:Uncharacterized protein n=2 Tax=Brevibacterium TaxID=1696 RepID=A0A366IGL4_9MICO|nr:MULTISPECIES: hypothetical protein [Brevibacterium]RBP62196.1 hypothetical protein DFO66_11611 [Brevibacterium sanguinis]RBP70672.1 hypothetical protein DFO65_108125 [Brevibacterium celere]
MTFLKRALIAAVASLSLVVGPAVAANAAATSFDVTKLSAKSIVVSDANCRNVDVHMSHKKSGVDNWDVYADVTRRGGWVGSADFSSSGDTKKTRAFICPSLDGLGKYGLGPSEVFAYSESSWDMVDRTDYTKGHFYVRGKATASLSAKRSGKSVTLSAKTKRYDPESYGWVNYNPKVKFQVKKNGKWKTVKTIKAKKGKATYKVKSKGKKSYRIVFDQVSWATGAKSKTVKK